MTRTFLALMALLASASSLLAHDWGRERGKLAAVNARIHGTVLDYTQNHGADHRLWSAALHEKRDLYVYLPPNYAPCRCYPFMIYLHGLAQDEYSFLKYIVEPLDAAIASGALPPFVIAAPDGSVGGNGRLFEGGSFFLNTRAGKFEDWVMQDVWDFMFAHYSLCPEREAHVLNGVSMGGGAAYNLGIKYRDRVAVVLGLFPPLNTRWMDCHGQYRSKFDPCCWGWRTDVDRGCEVLARFGPFAVRIKRLLDPIVNRREPQEALEEISRENPTEMLETYDVRPGQLALYVGYGGKDQFHMDAQIESFLYRARQRGLCVGVSYDPEGKHDVATGVKLFPEMVRWLGEQMRRYR